MVQELSTTRVLNSNKEFFFDLFVPTMEKLENVS